MKNIYIFMFLVTGILSACSSATDTVKSDLTSIDTERDAPTITPEALEDTAKAQAAPHKHRSAEGTQEVFHDNTSGISLIIPEGWQKLSYREIVAAQQSVKLSDEDLEKAVRENPNAPLLVITRYSEPYPTLNPAVTVTLRPTPIEGIPSKDFLNMLMQLLKPVYPDLTYVDEVQEAKVDGLTGAYTKFKYTVGAENKKSPAMTRMWLVPRGQTTFIIGMSGPQEGPDVSEEYFNEILQSVRIQK